MIVLRVALDVPLPKLFDYRAEEATRADIGYRALVPFGKKHRVGVIVDVAAKSEVADSRLRAVGRILRDVPPLPRDWLALAQFCSDYYQRPLGEVVAGPCRRGCERPNPFPLLRSTMSSLRPAGIHSQRCRRDASVCALCFRDSLTVQPPNRNSPRALEAW